MNQTVRVVTVILERQCVNMILVGLETTIKSRDSKQVIRSRLTVGTPHTVLITKSY